MKYAAVILLFVGLALAAPKQNPLLQADDCLHCVEDIVNAVAECQVRTLIFLGILEEFLKTFFTLLFRPEFLKNSDGAQQLKG